MSGHRSYVFTPTDYCGFTFCTERFSINAVIQANLPTRRHRTISEFELNKNSWRKIMAETGLRELYIDELKDLYSAENQIIKALPKMIKAASSPKLKAGFEEHLQQTRNQVERLEKIFKELDESPKGKKCKGMEGLIEEGKELMEEDAEPEVLDAGLIAAAQKVEHYEIAGYGPGRTSAEI